MLTTNAFAGIGALVGDPARASMLVALMDGRALTATELATVAGVSPQTASSHLAQLVAGELVAVERQGRHRYHRVATPAIAQMIEGMMAVAATGSANRRAATPTGPKDLAMRRARTCYDHLAGRVAVAIADSMVVRGEIRFGVDGGELTGLGARLLVNAGFYLPQEDGRRGRRAFCRPCLDWSERRPHIAGLVGRALLHHSLEWAWLRTVAGSRAVIVTPLGRRMLASLFELSPDLWEDVV
ncbi:ArsR/SmtB family transcription factor [Sphingomonas endolithica]|uniref:ArsR/SmtB family transcription factor n=1 Tax=Sphingomonas endolithica TaxID=2972485 RepID=UPI0021AF6B2A|nr:winged helix-turn-helix domain-containing protein [Sphingomonas sp. ZFBP2030]